jgi:hypothetical protein
MLQGLVRGSEILNPVSRDLSFFAWFCGILCCRVQIFWHPFTILGPKAFRNHFSIWLVKGSEILNPVSRDLSFFAWFCGILCCRVLQGGQKFWTLCLEIYHFLHDFAEFYVAGFRFSDTVLQYRGLKPSEIALVFGLWGVQKFWTPCLAIYHFLHDFAEFYVAGFRFSDTLLQCWVLKPSEITLVFGL